MNLLQKPLRQKITIVLTLLVAISFVFAKPDRAYVVPGAGRMSGVNDAYDLTNYVLEQEAFFDPDAEDLSMRTWTRYYGDSLMGESCALILGADCTPLKTCVQERDCIANGNCDQACGPLIEWTGVVPVAHTMIAGVFERPNVVTLAAYRDNVLANSFLGKTAYAQTGAGLLAPVLQIWQMTRNIAYFGFVLVLIAVGFMIMFRYKLGPQTSVTLMNALPKIAIALVLVTFSYPIVALFLDITWGVISALAQSAIHPSTMGLDLGTDTMFKDMYSGGFWNIIAAVGVSLVEIGYAVTMVLVVFIALVLGVVNFIVRFTKIALMTAFAPLILAWGAVPGNDAISGWFKGIISNCLSMVGILIFIMLGIYFWVAIPRGFADAIGGAPGIPWMAAFMGNFLSVIVLFQSWKIPGVIDKALAGKGVPGWYTRGGGGKR